MEELLPYLLLATDILLFAAVIWLLFVKRKEIRSHKTAPEHPHATKPAVAYGGLELSRLIQLAQAETFMQIGLTPKETQVAALIMKGKPYVDIASDLGVSLRTVQSHASSTFAKAGIASRGEFETLIHRETMDLLDGYSPNRAHEQDASPARVA